MAGYRKRYEVWRQGYVRAEGPQYAAECLTCKKWICRYALTRKEAWEICKEHEELKHEKV